MIHRVFSRLTSSHGFHTSTSYMAATRFNLPAMSPTMTEGTIIKWVKQEGESFSAGDVLFELETDKAQIDVEAPEDGILAKIIMKEGSKAPVNTLIAIMAEEGDDISSLDIPSEEVEASSEKKEEKKEPAPAASTPVTHKTSHVSISDIKTSQHLMPSVLNLVLRYGIKDVDAIKGSGKDGRVLKGDVLAHLGLIKPQPAPKPRLTAAPPRDQIVLAKRIETKKPEKKVLPSFISKEVFMDDLSHLRHQLNELNKSALSVNDLIAKAAERALQDVNVKKTYTPITPIANGNNGISHRGYYAGGKFKIFDLAEPTYEFITDSYEPGKPYVMTVSKKIRNEGTPKQEDMLDIIGYLGGDKPSESRNIHFSTKDNRLNMEGVKKVQKQLNVEIQLDGGVPGKILNDKRASAFLDRVEYYLAHPKELVM